MGGGACFVKDSSGSKRLTTSCGAFSSRTEMRPSATTAAFSVSRLPLRSSTFENVSSSIAARVVLQRDIGHHGSVAGRLAADLLDHARDADVLAVVEEAVVLFKRLQDAQHGA